MTDGVRDSGRGRRWPSTDHQGAFLLHCRNLEHEDMAMMADFITV